MKRSRLFRIGFCVIGLAGLLGLHSTPAEAGMTIANKLPIPSEAHMYPSVIDTINQFAYVAVGNSGNTHYGNVIEKINVTNWQIVNTLTPPGAIGGAAVIDAANGYAYFAGISSIFSPSVLIFRLNLNTFTIDNTLTIQAPPVGLEEITSGVIDTTNHVAYFGGQGCANALCTQQLSAAIKINLTTFSQSGSALLLDPAQTQGTWSASAAALDTTNQVIYFASWDSSSKDLNKIIKVDAANWDVLQSLTLNQGESPLWDAAIFDPTSGHALFGMPIGANGSEVLTLNSSLNRLSTLDLPGVTITRAAIDSTGFAYFYSPVGPNGTCPSGGSCFTRIFQINLSNGQVWDAINLGASDFGALTLAMDAAHEVMYAGLAYQNTDTLDKITLTPIQNPLAISLNPNTAIAGSPAFNLTITYTLGSFTAGDLAYWNDLQLGPMTGASTVFSIPAVYISTPGIVSVQVLQVSGQFAAANFNITYPPPIISTFTATPSIITMGQSSSTLSWSTLDSTSVVIDNGVGPESTAGSVLVSPAVTTTYTLTASGPGGSTTATVTVTVVPPPVINSFTATPSTITAGNSSTLAWTTSGAVYVTLDDPIFPLQAVLNNGIEPVSPSVTTTYTLTAINAAGFTVTQQVTVTVLPNASFTATPSTITVGGSSTLIWTSTNATTVSIDNGVGSVSSNGSQSVSPAVTTTYTLTATNVSGSITRQAVVVVVPPPDATFSANPLTITAADVSTLTWTSTNATSVSIDNGIGSVALNGNLGVTPAVTTTYTLTATNLAGTSITRQVTVTVLPPPDATFTAAPSTITVGNSSSLSWTSTNATSVSIDNGIGSVALNGSQNVSPAVTTTYTLTATNSIGSSITRKVTITVVPPPDATFTAVPSTITVGNSSSLSWTSTNATSVSIDNGIGSVALNGSQNVSPAVTTTYTLTATNAAGTSVTRQVTILVVPPPSATFTANPTTIYVGQTSTLSWTSSNATNVSIDQGIGPVALNGSQVISPSVSTTYTLTATNIAGTSVTRQVTVTVVFVDLGITKTDSVNHLASLGQNFDYTITVTNYGTGDALGVGGAGVIMTDTIQDAGVQLVSLPASCSGPSVNTPSPFSFTCNLGTVAAGATAPVLTITVKPTAVGTVHNAASVPSDPSEPTPDTHPNSTQIATDIVIFADLAITKTASVATIYTGKPFSYSLTVSNLGPSPVSGVGVTDNLPPQVSYVSSTISPTDGTCSASGNSFGCTITRTMNVGDQVAIVVNVIAQQPGSQVPNTAVIDLPTGVHDNNLSNNSATASVNILEAPYLFKIVVAPDGKIIGLSDLLPLTAQAFDQYNNDITDQVTFNWSLDNPAGALAVSGAQSTFRTTAGISGYEMFTVTASAVNSHNQLIQGDAHITVINAPSATGDICGAHAYPVPWKPTLGVDHVTFTHLAPATTIRIFTTDARQVSEMQSVFGEDVPWNLRNANGENVASGVYLTIIDQANGFCSRVDGKIVIIR